MIEGCRLLQSQIQFYFSTRPKLSQSEILPVENSNTSMHAMISTVVVVNGCNDVIVTLARTVYAYLMVIYICHFSPFVIV